MSLRAAAVPLLSGLWNPDPASIRGAAKHGPHCRRHNPDEDWLRAFFIVKVGWRNDPNGRCREGHRCLLRAAGDTPHMRSRTFGTVGPIGGRNELLLLPI